MNWLKGSCNPPNSHSKRTVKNIRTQSQLKSSCNLPNSSVLLFTQTLKFLIIWKLIWVSIDLWIKFIQNSIDKIRKAALTQEE
jgi:hypothetical protein